MNWNGQGRSRTWLNSGCNADICMERQRIRIKILSQDSGFLGRDLKLGSPECKGGVLTILSQRLVWKSLLIRPNTVTNRGVTHRRRFRLSNCHQEGVAACISRARVTGVTEYTATFRC
jgi:hypothetical protein